MVGVALATVSIGASAWDERAFVVASGVVGGAAAADFSNALRSKGVATRPLAAVLGAMLFPPMAYRWGEEGIAFAVAGTLIVAAATFVVTGMRPEVLRSLGTTVFSCILIGLLSGYAVLLRVSAGEKLVYVYAITLAGYLIGRVPGIRRIGGPSISASIPSRPWSALGTGVAGALMGAAVSIVLFAPSFSVAVAIPLGIVVGLAATLGDIGGRLLRMDVGIGEREASVPGYGGVMARLDTALLSMPAFFYAFRLYLT